MSARAIHIGETQAVQFESHHYGINASKIDIRPGQQPPAVIVMTLRSGDVALLHILATDNHDMPRCSWHQIFAFQYSTRGGMGFRLPVRLTVYKDSPGHIRQYPKRPSKEADRLRYHTTNHVREVVS